MLSSKELNFHKDVVADILHSSDNFSWVPERKFSLNCCKGKGRVGEYDRTLDEAA